MSIAIGTEREEGVAVVDVDGDLDIAAVDDVDAALQEAMTRLSPSRAAAEVAQALNLPKRDIYERAQQLKETR